MELGKLLIIIVAGLLLYGLWQGNAEQRKASLKEANGDAATESSEFIPSPTVYTKQQTAAVATEEVETPVRNTEVDNHEETYASYATYTYVRERDPGTSNTYSYRVEGCDQFGTAVEGSVNTRGASGKGYVTNEYGDHFWIITEWTEDGQLLGFDNEDNTYYLETSEIR